MRSVALHRFAHKLVKKFDLTLKRRTLRFLLPGLLLVIHPAMASDFISANGFHPIRGLFGFPVSYQHAGLATTRDSTWLLSLQVDHSNIFAGGSFPGENLVFDGETTRLTLAVNAATSRCTSLGVELPFVLHHPGFLDRVID